MSGDINMEVDCFENRPNDLNSGQIGTQEDQIVPMSRRLEKPPTVKKKKQATRKRRAPVLDAKPITRYFKPTACDSNGEGLPALQPASSSNLDKRPKHEDYYAKKFNREAVLRMSHGLVHPQDFYGSRFEVLGGIGKGDFSYVSRVKHPITGEILALKRSRKESTPLRRTSYIREVQAMARVRHHPNIVQMFDTWVEEDNELGEMYCITLELCSKSLTDVLQEVDSFTEDQMLEILRQVAGALAHIHSKGVVHMDVKPDNIFLKDKNTYKLGDFGLATRLDGLGHIDDGDGRYVDLKLMNNEVCSLDKSDIYSLGATMLQLLHGQKNFTRDNIVYKQMRSRGFPAPPNVSDNLWNLVKQMLHEDSTVRPAATEIVMKVESIQSTSASRLSQSTPRRTPRR